MATRRLFDGAQIELGILPLVQAATSGIVGNANITLDSFTLVSTASLLIRGNANITLDPVTVSSTGSLSISGALSRTLDDFTLVSTASLLIRGNANITLDPVTVSSAARLFIAANANITLDNFTLSATGTLSTPSGSCPSANEIAQAVWNYILEGSVSAGQMLRGVTRTQLAKVDINETTGQVTIYKLDGTTIFAQASTSPTGDRNAPTIDWS